VNAEFIVVMGDKAVLKTENGKTLKIPMDRVSKEDLEYNDLERPLKRSIFRLGAPDRCPNRNSCAVNRPLNHRIICGE